MKLKKNGIDQLEKIMLANKQHYNHDVSLVAGTGCNSQLCAAGFAHLLKVGEKQFAKEAAVHVKNYNQAFVDRCFKSGGELLGIKRRFGGRVILFDYVWSWPTDLRDKYDSIKTPLARVRFYIKILRERGLSDGTFSPLVVPERKLKLKLSLA